LIHTRCLRQTSQWLPESELHNVSIGIAHHRKVSHDAAHIHRWLNQNVLLTRLLGNAIDFFATVALKAEMIQPRLHFVLDDHQNEDGIFSRRCSRTEPNIVAAFKPPIAHDREATERSVKVDRSVEIACVDCDVSPASWHVSVRAPTSLSAVREHPARPFRWWWKMPALSLLRRQLTIQLHDLKRHVRRRVHVLHVEPFLNSVDRAHAGAEVGAFDPTAIEDIRVTAAA
jgi:hypothetical protein